MSNRLSKKLSANRWALGFVRGGMRTVMESDHLECDWVPMPSHCWMADPFVLDVTDTEILLLVEEMPYALHKGIITLLHINKSSMTITARKVLLEIPTHLSFPAIWRKNGHIYVCPESAKSGKLDMYEYHSQTETLTFVSTICDDVVWDSYITDSFGTPLMFTAAHNDYTLDIYQWNAAKNRFLPYLSIPSDKPNSRMGGAIFEYKGQLYYPAQNCSQTYGGSIDIKRIDYKDGKFTFTPVKNIQSPHPRYPLGLHTINEYKGVVVIDVKGYRYPLFGAIINYLSRLKRRLCH